MGVIPLCQMKHGANPLNGIKRSQARAFQLDPDQFAISNENHYGHRSIVVVPLIQPPRKEFAIGEAPPPLGRRTGGGCIHTCSPVSRTAS